MSRQLKVAREKAVEAAMYVFWAKGYESTSVDDLQNAIGIQRGSFYLHFKDKRSLFIEVLDHYKLTIVEKRRTLVRASASPKDGIHLYFKILIDHLVSKKSNSGCLNTNTAIELGLSDEEISEKMGLGMNGWKEFWIEILKKAQEKKEISSKLDIVSQAQFLVGMTQGLNVVARVNPDPDFLNGIIKSGLSTLENS
jgi:TetR/AcrR family transcriptional regulator, transcriptional repressor for nem operon